FAQSSLRTAKFAKKYHGLRGHRFSAADGFEPFVGLCFDVHVIDINSKNRRKGFAHRLNVRPKLRALGQHRNVDVSNTVAAFRDQLDYLCKKIQAGSSGPSRISVREVRADIAKRGGSQQ